jgi:endogenous inhibitor of DNA gyrase (YacG/DUF329 family)
MSTNLPRRAAHSLTACPICGQAGVAPHTPFCSQGCRDRDLLQWLGEGYRVPGARVETDEQD